MKIVLAILFLCVASLGLAPAAMAHDGVPHLTTPSASAQSVAVEVSTTDMHSSKATQVKVAADKCPCGNSCAKCNCSMVNCCQHMGGRACNLSLAPLQSSRNLISDERQTSGVMPEAIAEPPKHS